ALGRRKLERIQVGTRPSWRGGTSPDIFLLLLEVGQIFPRHAVDVNLEGQQQRGDDVVARPSTELLLEELLAEISNRDAPLSRPIDLLHGEIDVGSPVDLRKTKSNFSRLRRQPLHLLTTAPGRGI